MKVESGEPWGRGSPAGFAAPTAAPLPTALIFDGSTNPAHPKHIGSIDPNCCITEVVKGEPSVCAWSTEEHSGPAKLPWPEGDPFPSGWGPHPRSLMLGMPSVDAKRTACWVRPPIPG